MTRRTQFILSLAVTVAASVLIHATRPVNPDPRMEKEWFWAMKTHDTADKDLVIYGDSRVSQAVDTRPLLEVFPDATPHNMGYNGAGFNEEMFDHLWTLTEGKESSMVFILGFTPYSLSTEAMNNAHFLEEWNRPATDVRVRLHLYQLLHVFDPIAPSMYHRDDTAEGHYITYNSDGWEQAYEIPEDPRKWLKAFRRHFERTQVDPVNIAATIAFVEECAARGIPVFGFRPPSTREMEKIENETSGFDEAAFIDAFEDAGGAWVRFEDRFAYYSYDGSHLDYRAARQFSRDLAAAIEDLL